MQIILLKKYRHTNRQKRAYSRSCTMCSRLKNIVIILGKSQPRNWKTFSDIISSLKFVFELIHFQKYHRLSIYGLLVKRIRKLEIILFIIFSLIKWIWEYFPLNFQIAPTLLAGVGGWTTGFLRVNLIFANVIIIIITKITCGDWRVSILICQ